MTTRPFNPLGPDQAPDQRPDQRRPGGNALPSQETPEGIEQANELRDELIAATWPALGNHVDDYERPVAEPAPRLTPRAFVICLPSSPVPPASSCCGRTTARAPGRAWPPPRRRSPIGLAQRRPLAVVLRLAHPRTELNHSTSRIS